MSLHESIVTDMSKVISDMGDCSIISPTSLALKVQSEYAEGKLEPHIEYTSLEGLKSIARKLLAGNFDADGEANSAHQGEMFSGHLQDRYPVPRKKGVEPVYKLREALTSDEVMWNVRTLRKSAEARLLHADALEAWHQSTSAQAA
jgi:hypothetical protein